MKKVNLKTILLFSLLLFFILSLFLYSKRMYPWFDFTAGLTSFLASILVLFKIFDVRTLNDVLNIYAPKKKWSLFLLINSTVFFNSTGDVFYYVFRAFRGDYPVYADSLGIPIDNSITGTLWFLPIINILFLVFVPRTNKNELLFQRRNSTLLVAKLADIFLLLVILLQVFSLIMQIKLGDTLRIPPTLSFIYLYLSFRAKILGKFFGKTQ